MITEPLETDDKTRLTKKQQHRVALLVAGLPLGLGLMLFVMNPDYIGAMFRELCGWMMLAAIFICVSIAYIALRVSFALSNQIRSSQLEPPGWLMHRVTLRLILPGCVIALFVVPAVFLVLLGPAVLVLMRSGVLGTI